MQPTLSHTARHALPSAAMRALSVEETQGVAGSYSESYASGLAANYAAFYGTFFAGPIHVGPDWAVYDFVPTLNGPYGVFMNVNTGAFGYGQADGYDQNS